MKRLSLTTVLALALMGCGDAYDDIASACQASEAVKALPEAKAEAFCVCQAEMAKEKNHPEDALKMFAAKWRGEEPKNVPVMVQGDWFLFQLQCMRRTDVKL